MLRSNSACKLEGLTLYQLCTKSVSWQLSCIVGIAARVARELWCVASSSCKDRDSNPKCNRHTVFCSSSSSSSSSPATAAVPRVSRALDRSRVRERSERFEECGRWMPGRGVLDHAVVGGRLAGKEKGRELREREKWGKRGKKMGKKIKEVIVV
jgi:hypothetical protein